MQRLTAIANIVLVSWFLISAMTLAGASYDETKAWMASPVTTCLMLLLVTSAFYHAKLGVQVVIEDYVHHGGLKIAAITALTLGTIALGVACAVAILKTSLAT
jgi:succinate dehydrogenase / fumarate reductase membrane anchor subunit